MYQQRYLPLRACHERQDMVLVKAVAEQDGLWLTLDGLAPEGGEAQLWLVANCTVGSCCGVVG